MRSILSTSIYYSGPPTVFTLELLEIVLSQNYFRFETDWYRQIAGTSIGAAMAPMYANGYMFETRYILEPYKDRILKYVRYIDDIFMLIKGSISEAEEMIRSINLCTNNIKLTAVIVESSTFLGGVTTSVPHCDVISYI
ncbi:Hypothetical predicted protein [Pelobates cultripes]|uniref:Reverse transcriptase domain-containing protein n=1 Tax=Pelobates cultripes TaxID=61616 RepID=A0AAD1RL47_PELCU|nr:Hypothetical predicted protein [Pelobates cultripes]